MGASKTYQYSKTELQTAKIARALSHPARIRIIKILSENKFVRNIDLTHELSLVSSTVHDHLIKLQDADLIDFNFRPNCYLIRLKNDPMDQILRHFEP